METLFELPPVVVDVDKKQKRKWENAFQRWSNDKSQDSSSPEGCCGNGQMKTLEEVIQTLDYCKFSSDCKPCPYLKDKECTRSRLTDASYYLKEYQSEKKLWEADRKMWAEKGPEIEKKEDKLIKAAKDFLKAKAEMEEISANYVALKQWWTEQQENPPLTWDELCKMEDTPVWLEWSSDGAWVLIANKVDNDLEYFRYCDDRIFVLTRDDYVPDKWQAYRKERE